MQSDFLPADLADFVQHELAVGRYASAQHVFCDAVRLLKERQEELDSLRGKIDAAAEQLDRGEGRPFDADRIRAEIARRLAAPVE